MLFNKLAIIGVGMIGGSLARYLVASEKYYVVGVDNLQTGSKANLPKEGLNNFHFIKGDVNEWRDISSIFYCHNFDYVFHYAATVGVQRTLQNPIMVLRDIQGIENVLALCKSASVERLFFTSSSEVYGEPVESPQCEQTTPLNSRLPYAIVKNVGEAFIKSYYQEYGLPYTILRLFNTYGPLQSDDFVISKFINLALRNKDIPLYGGGAQTRTFCHVDDNLEFVFRLLETNRGIGETFNVGNDIEITVRDLAAAIINATGSKSSLIDYPPLEEGDMTRRCPDISKMRSVLERDLISLSEGLEKILNTDRFLWRS